jgi:protein-tyrosine phosphatase
MSEAKMGVLFVCLGNICRSPTAEGVFLKLISEGGTPLASRVSVDSAGVSDWHAGDAPDPRSQMEAARHGVDLSGQRSRVVTAADFEEFEYIVSMDRSVLRALRQMCPKQFRDRLYLFTNFGPETKAPEVPDPYEGGAEGFAQVYHLIEACSAGLLKHMEDRAGIRS